MFKVKNKFDVLYIAVIFIILIFAVYLRTIVYFDIRPLWHDEAPVALTVINNNFSSLFSNIVDYQKAPPLFWILIKIFGKIGNYNELSLRFFPFICSVFSVFVFFFFSKEVLDKKIPVIIANILFAVNYRLIYFAQELKQYSADVLFFCAALIFFGKMINKPLDFKTMFSCLLFSSFIILFSLPSFFVIGAFVLYKIICFFKNKQDISNKVKLNPQIKYFLLFNLIFAGIAFWYYKKFFADIYNIEIMYLSEYWNIGFLNYSNSFSILKSLFSYFLYPNATFIFELIFCSIGFICLFLDKKYISKLILFSFLFIAAASILKLYPLYERVALFLIPIMVVIIAKPFDCIKLNPAKLAAVFFLFILSIPIYMFPQYYINFFNKNIFNVFDGRESLYFIKNIYNPNQKILINRASLRIFEYYKRQLNFNTQNYEIFDYRKINKEEFFKYLDKNKDGKTWIYYVYTGRDNQERLWLDEWRDVNKNYIKKEFLKNKSYIIKI